MITNNVTTSSMRLPCDLVTWIGGFEAPLLDLAGDRGLLILLARPPRDDLATSVADRLDVAGRSVEI